MTESSSSLMSPQINELADALSKAQAKIKGAVKDASNPFFKSKYADLASIWEACRDALTSNGLSVLQPIYEGHICTILAHKSGQWVMSKYPISPLKNEPQSFGSAITYARRYALASMVGVTPEDDDAEAAHGRNYGPQKPTYVPTATTQAYKPQATQPPAQSQSGSMFKK